VLRYVERCRDKHDKDYCVGLCPAWHTLQCYLSRLYGLVPRFNHKLIATDIQTAIFEDTVSNMDDRSALEEQHPLKGVGKPRDIVGAAVFLASEEAGWVTGVNLPVDGGFTCR